MKQIYALYKENFIPTVGGVNPQNIETGIANINEWKLCRMNKELFSNFSEYKLYPIDDTVAQGIILLSNENYNPIQADADVQVDGMFTELNDTEKQLATAASTFLNKLDLKLATRAHIRKFKDFKDDLADTKLLMETAFMFLAEEYNNLSEADKKEADYAELIEVVSTIDDSKLRINYDNIDLKIKQIIDDETIINRIIKTQYIDQLK